MIKVFGVGRGKKAEPTTEAAGGSTGQSENKRQPGEIRMQKELDELDLPTQVRREAWWEL